MGATLNKFLDQFEKFQTLPGGETFRIEVTDAEATAAAKEYVSENKAQIKKMLKQAAGVGLDVDDPAIRFVEDGVLLSAKGGKGLVKAKASLAADVKWDGDLSVVVRSVNVPIIKVSPESLNSTMEKPLRQLMEKVEEYAEVRSFKVKDGAAVLEAVRK